MLSIVPGVTTHHDKTEVLNNFDIDVHLFSSPYWKCIQRFHTKESIKHTLINGCFNMAIHLKLEHLSTKPMGNLLA